MPDPFTCPSCGAVSHNPNDAAQRYCGRCHFFVDDATTQHHAATMTDPLLRPWRSHQGLAVLRLRADVVGARRIPVRRTGDLVFAAWSSGQPPLAKGWLIQDVGFLCVMNEPEVEVIERP